MSNRKSTPKTDIPAAADPGYKPGPLTAEKLAEKQRLDQSLQEHSQVDGTSPIVAPEVLAAEQRQAQRDAGLDAPEPEEQEPEAAPTVEELNSGDQPETTFSKPKTARQKAAEARARGNVLYQVNLRANMPLGRNPLYVEAKDEDEAKQKYIDAKRLDAARLESVEQQWTLTTIRG